MYQSEAKANEIRKQEEKNRREDYKRQAFKDALQWRSFIDDHSSEIMFISMETGELRSGAANALDWMIQDDGHGFPCFYNTATRQIVYEDPRFKGDVDEDLLQQRKYCMQELRFLLYICKNLWDEYNTILDKENEYLTYRQIMKIRNAPQIPQLSAFIIRAKALYQPSSIVDKPLDKALIEEFDYASYIVVQLSDLANKGEEMIRDRKDKKLELMEKLTVNNGEVVYCKYCKRETKKHLSYCPTCGKQQIFY
jgi:hypothetical protein